MSEILNVECKTCTSARTLPSPPYPVTIQHSCDMVEPRRAFWALFPEGVEPPTGTLR